MPKYLHTTFGTKKVLQGVREAHPQAQLMLTVSAKDGSRYQLLDLTDMATSFFTTPISYEILCETGASDTVRGWMDFAFITLSEQERDNFIRRWERYQQHGFDQQTGFVAEFLMQRVDDPRQIAILTTWVTEQDWENWRDQPNNPLAAYENPNSMYGLRDAQYEFAAFAK